MLTRLKDYAGATDQYIEILNRYSEDEDVTREAASYAGIHGRAQQLSAYYDKAAKDSPRDFRWPMLQARTQTHFENFPEALIAYGRAQAIRPDRVDFYTASGGLQERLLRFDEAAAIYAKLYELNYHKSQWMEKFAAVRARQGQTDAAVKALNTALIQGQPSRPDNFFLVATRLESWNMLRCGSLRARDDAVAAARGGFHALIRPGASRPGISIALVTNGDRGKTIFHAG